MRAPSCLARLRPWALAFAACLCAGAAALWPLPRYAAARLLADDALGQAGVSDAYNFLWSYWWVQKAAANGWSPFHCDWVCPPGGVDLFYHTMVVLPSLLTWPIAALGGTLVGYNAMVWLMLSSAAFGLIVFLRRVMAFGWPASVWAGWLFGFSPYFIFKAHNGLNCLGACFWANALAALLAAYLARRFTFTRGIVFAAFAWASFWTSLEEFFMLGVMCAAVVVVMEARALRRGQGDWRGKAAFLPPLLLGAASLAALWLAPRPAGLARPRVDGFGLLDLFSPAVFTWPGAVWRSAERDYWGVGLPWSAAALAFLGCASAAGEPGAARSLARRLALLLAAAAAAEALTTPPSVAGRVGAALTDAAHWLALALLVAALSALLFGLAALWERAARRGVGPRRPFDEDWRWMAALALAAIACALDVLHAPSALIRLAPFGRAFRVFSRFYPFALFFLMLFVARGLDWLWSRRSESWARWALTAAFAATFVECVPRGLHPSPAPRFHLPEPVARRLDRRAFVWYAAQDSRLTNVDTYQIWLDLPAVHEPALSRGAVWRRRAAVQAYPILYKRRRRFSASEFLSEARRLRVRYILFESPRQRAAFPVPTRPLAADAGRVLAELAE